MSDTIFDKIDAQKRSFLGINPVAALWNVRVWRIYFALCVFGSLVFWGAFGFDSTWSQILPFVEGFPALLNGETTLSALWAESRVFYGIGNHWSAPVIYGLSFIALSLYLERVGIKKSYNFFITTALSLGNIGVFELAWNSLYAHFQGQIWTITFQWKQVANLTFFIGFTLIGVLTILYLYLDGYRANLGYVTKALTVAALLSWMLWIAYPGPVEFITVETSTGTWTNTANFPQTYYAVDVLPDDNLAMGEPHHVENDLIHLVNTGTKVLTVGAILSFCMVRKNVIA